MVSYYEKEINSTFLVGVGDFLPNAGNEIVVAFENGSVKIFDHSLQHVLASYDLDEQFSLLYAEYRECFSGDADGDGLDEPIFCYDNKIAIINYNDQIMKIEIPSAQYEGRIIDRILFVEDLDNNGKCDIVFRLMTSDESYHDSIGVLWGDDLSMDIRVFNNINTQIGGCVAGDFNGDGSQDLLLYCLEEGIGGNLYLLNSSTLGTIGSWFISSSGSYDVLKVNINNDSRDDFVLYSYTSVISYTWNISTGNPIKVSSINTTLGFYVKVGNEDSDETNELILINGSSTYSQWEAIYWDPNGTVINRMNVQTDGVSIQDFTVCLANNDDRDDIAIFASDDYRTFIRLFDSRNLDKIGEFVKYTGNLGDYVFLGYDLNNDSAEDLLCLYGEYNHYFLLVLLSDSIIPSLSGFKIYPEHPTIYDGFIQASVYVQDNQGIKKVKFECSYDGGVSWEEASCYADPENPSLYKAFIPGPSKGGWIIVKVSVFDNFMNVLVKRIQNSRPMVYSC